MEVKVQLIGDPNLKYWGHNYVDKKTPNQT